MHHLSQEENQRRKGKETVIISKTIETEQGTVTFQGELDQEELDYVLTLGLNLLLQQGAINATVVHAPPENIQ